MGPGRHQCQLKKSQMNKLINSCGCESLNRSRCIGNLWKYDLPNMRATSLMEIVYLKVTTAYIINGYHIAIFISK